MMDSIIEFAKSSDGTLEVIQFVVYDDKMLDDFKAVVKSYKAAKTKQTSMMGAIWKAFKGKFIEMDNYSGLISTRSIIIARCLYMCLCYALPMSTYDFTLYASLVARKRRFGYGSIQTQISLTQQQKIARGYIFRI